MVILNMNKVYTIMFWFSISLTIGAVIVTLGFGFNLGGGFRGGIYGSIV